MNNNFEKLLNGSMNLTEVPSHITMSSKKQSKPSKLFQQYLRNLGNPILIVRNKNNPSFLKIIDEPNEYSTHEVLYAIKRKQGATKPNRTTRGENPKKPLKTAARLEANKDYIVEIFEKEPSMKYSLKVLQRAAEIQAKKSNDYQNPNSRIKQADYYVRGCSTILDTIHAKVLRMQSVCEAMESDPEYSQNFESLEDSCLDLINYASFFASYMNGEMDGQDPSRDMFNRPKVMTDESE